MKLYKYLIKIIGRNKDGFYNRTIVKTSRNYFDVNDDVRVTIKDTKYRGHIQKLIGINFGSQRQGMRLSILETVEPWANHKIFKDIEQVQYGHNEWALLNYSNSCPDIFNKE